MNKPAFHRMPSVRKNYAADAARGTIYDWMDRGQFPRPVKLGERSVAWRTTDLEEWAEDPQGWAAKQEGA